MKKIKLDCDVTYSINFECEVEVPDDFDPAHVSASLEDQIRGQIVEAAREFDALMDVDEVDWFVA